MLVVPIGRTAAWREYFDPALSSHVLDARCLRPDDPEGSEHKVYRID
jgi:hypothetical protein